MKTLLLFTVCFFTLCHFEAQQVFNRAYQNVNEVPDPYLLNCCNDLYFSARIYVPHGVGTMIYRHGQSGIYKSSIGLTSGDVYFALKSNDNKLIYLGRSSACDVLPQEQHNFITKMDTNGVILFSSTYTVNSGDHVKACVQLQDSTFFSFTDSLLITHSKSGQFISKINLGINSISSALLLSNNTVLLSAKSGNQNTLITLNSTLALGQMTSTPILFKKLSYYGSQSILGLGTDAKLYKFTQNFILAGSSAFSNGLSVSDFVNENDTIYSILHSSSGISNYAVTDTSFTNISLSSSATHSLEQIAICMNGTNIAILSSGLSASTPWSSYYSHYFSSLSSINKFSNHNFTSDLALVSVIADSSYSSCYFSVFPTPGEYHCTSYQRVKIKVKNKGTSEIKHFTLNCFDSPAIDCGAYIYREQFSGLSLLPGDSIELTGTKFARKAWAYYGSAPSFTNNFCFYTTLPNGETDKTVEDNELCNTLNFLITSSKQNFLKEMVIKLSPNPFTDNLNIESDVLIKEIKIMNSLGMLVKRIEAKNTELIIDNSDLANGVYFITIETEKGTIQKKVIKN